MLRKLLLLVMAFVFVVPLQVSALTSSDLQSLNSDSLYYWADQPKCAASFTGTSSGATSSTGSVWASGLQPPYYLEVFAINVLEDLASKMGVDSSKAVTQEHVVALIGWFWAEGGDINNQDLFNPLNTGINRPDLLATANAGNGLQSFKSFDAGVEATALTMTGSNQNRIAQALTDPSVNAEDFVHALTYYQQYPGNNFWAQADQADQQGYYNSLLASVEQARTHYSTEAATIMGTPDKEEIMNERVPASQLQFDGGTSNAVDGADGATVSLCSGAGAINCNSPSITNATTLSQTRQNVVCIAERELAAWTPPPAVPRLGFTKYTQDVVGSVSSPEEWCADFASWVYDQAGYPLKPDPNWRVPGVVSIQGIAELNQNFHWHDLTDRSDKFYDGSYIPRPGDLAIHGGRHVNIVISVAGNNVTLIGGDQRLQGDSQAQYGGPDSTSVVSIEQISSLTGDGITGYVSPD